MPSSSWRNVITNSRPIDVQRAMAAVIHGALGAAIEAQPRWQFCVLIEPFDKVDYLKRLTRMADRRAHVQSRDAPVKVMKLIEQSSEPLACEHG